MLKKSREPATWYLRATKTLAELKKTRTNSKIGPRIGLLLECQVCSLYLQCDKIIELNEEAIIETRKDFNNGLGIKVEMMWKLKTGPEFDTSVTVLLPND